MKAHILEVSQELNVKPGLIRTALYVGNRRQYYTLNEIPKRSGGVRTIHAVNGRLRVLQKVAYNWLSNNYSPRHEAKGFVIGGGIIENAKIHRNKKLVICYDLKDFFPSITFARVQGMFMSFPFEFAKPKATLFAQICCLPDENGPIPQGGVTSPFVSNMICRRLDTRLHKLAIIKRMQYSRYADDLTFSTDDNVNYEKFTKIVKDIIEDEHFELNEEKSRIRTIGDRQIVTGIVVNEGLNVNRKYIRSLRATLHNCYMHGILSQIDKKTKYKDPWNTCSPIKKIANKNYILYKNGKSIEIKAAKEKFMEHLLGRIQFIGHVAKSNEHLNPIHYNKRKEIFKKLKNMHDKVKLNEGISGRIAWQAKNALNKHRNNSLIEEIKEYSRNELNDFVFEQKKSDPRYFTSSFSEGDIMKYRDEVSNFAQYPSPTNEMVMQYLNSLKDSENTVLGKLVHNTTISMGQFNNFKKQFGKDKFKLPKRLRDSFDIFINTDVLNFIKDKKTNFNTFSDERFVENTIYKFKRNTRFSNTKGTKMKDETDLVKTIKRAFKQNNPNNIEINVDEINAFGFYTDVTRVKYALKLIIESMLDNSNGNTVFCKTEIQNKAIEIFDDNPEPLNILPNRDFVHGKLRKAIYYLIALCDYSIIANFNNGGWKEINMMKDEVTDSVEYHGFTHRLTFR